MSDYLGDGYPPVAAGRHSSYFYHLRQRPVPTTKLDVKAIASADNLAVVYDVMARENGPAPGPDGLTYSQVGPSELYEVLRPVSEAVIAGTYSPGPARRVPISKGAGKGFRELTIRSVIDRVVAKALTLALTPFWEKVFLNGSHGFRPGRSNKTLLAQLQRGMLERNCWVLVSDDIRNAFDSLDLALVMADHRRYIGDDSLLRLIEAVLYGGDANRRIGIDQGSPYMPTTLNVHLHHVFDQPAHDLGVKLGFPMPWFRYADNVVVACRDVQEGQQILTEITTKLKEVGLALKGENDGKPVDLRKCGRTQLLGFIPFRRKGRLSFRLTPNAWISLREKLLEAHLSGDPNSAARAVLDGWIDAHSPALARRNDRTVDIMLRLAGSLGFLELWHPLHYVRECHDAHRRWRDMTAFW